MDNNSILSQSPSGKAIENEATENGFDSPKAVDTNHNELDEANGNKENDTEDAEKTGKMCIYI